jgi:hypothetical protein
MKEGHNQPLPISTPSPADIIRQVVPNTSPEEVQDPQPEPVVDVPDAAPNEPTPIPSHTVTRYGRISRPPASFNEFPMVIYEATQDIQSDEPNLQ